MRYLINLLTHWTITLPENSSVSIFVDIIQISQQFSMFFLSTVPNVKSGQIEAQVWSVPHPCHNQLLLSAKNWQIYSKPRTKKPRKTHLRGCNAEKSDDLVYGCRKRQRSEKVSAAESAADSPGSSSLSPRNPTPSQATRTELENVRNSLTHLLAALHVLTPIG